MLRNSSLTNSGRPAKKAEALSLGLPENINKDLRAAQQIFVLLNRIENYGKNPTVDKLVTAMEQSLSRLVKTLKADIKDAQTSGQSLSLEPTFDEEALSLGLPENINKDYRAAQQIFALLNRIENYGKNPTVDKLVTAMEQSLSRLVKTLKADIKDAQTSGRSLSLARDTSTAKITAKHLNTARNAVREAVTLLRTAKTHAPSVGPLANELNAIITKIDVALKGQTDKL